MLLNVRPARYHRRRKGVLIHVRWPADISSRILDIQRAKSSSCRCHGWLQPWVLRIDLTEENKDVAQSPLLSSSPSSSSLDLRYYIARVVSRILSLESSPPQNYWGPRDPGPPGHPGGLARWVDEFQSCSEFRGRTGQGSRLISGGGLRAPCIF